MFRFHAGFETLRRMDDSDTSHQNRHLCSATSRPRSPGFAGVAIFHLRNALARAVAEYGRMDVENLYIHGCMDYGIHPPIWSDLSQAEQRFVKWLTLSVQA
jgi:hypothetical protein